jgi:N-acetylglucosamine-6-sulfatase
VLLVIALVAVVFPATAPSRARAGVGRPNIVVIMTDDQRSSSLDKMPKTQKLLSFNGLALENFYVENSLCCPSRATFLTGTHSDTTGVWTNGDEGDANGGWVKFHPWEPKTIGVAMHDAGYRTAFVGKYLNGFDAAGLYAPPGWDRWWSFSRQNGAYFSYTAITKTIGSEPTRKSYWELPRDYSTDVIARTVSHFITAAPADEPLFAVAMPYAPHGPWTPAPRDEGQFDSTAVAFNPAQNEHELTDKPLFIQNHADMSAETMAEAARKEWTALQAVDDLVARVVKALASTGRLSNTLILYTSDNSKAQGEHNWMYKLDAYESSVNVPFIARFDGVIAPGSSQLLAANVDLAATIADYAGVAFPTQGSSLRPLLEQGAVVRRSVLFEHLDFGTKNKVPTYCGSRRGRLKYIRYAGGFEELYNLDTDPWELTNRAGDPRFANALASMRASTRLICPGPPGYRWRTRR